MKILFNDLGAQNLPLKESFLKRLDSILENSSYILDKNVSEFEESFSDFSQRAYSIGVSNGTDAIKLCIKNFNPSAKTLVVTQANTFVATTIAILDACENVTLKLVDVNDSYQMDLDLLDELLLQERDNYDQCIVVPVSMYGHTFNKNALARLQTQYTFYIVEDCSQAHGSKFEDGTLAGTVGDCSAFSLYPGKNLGSIGDAGIVNTDSKEIYDNIKMMRNYGSAKKYHHDKFGYNHRLDPIQAAFLCEKIQLIKTYNAIRHEIGERYVSEINNPLVVNFRNDFYCSYNTYHIYPVLVEDREKFCRYLDGLGIQNGIHYPIPIEKMPAFQHYNFNNPRTVSFSERLVSLPIHPFLNESDVNYVIESINSYKE